MSTLRELVAAWQAQGSRCKESFDRAVEGINRELDAVGGYATTSPELMKDGKGYCRDFWRQADSFGGGVSVVGEDAGGNHAGKVAPYQPEVGDRCYALEMAWRVEAYKLSDVVGAVRAYISKDAPHNRGMLDQLAMKGLAPEFVAAALVADEASERAQIVAWLRSFAAECAAGSIAPKNLADHIERGDHWRKED